MTGNVIFLGERPDAERLVTAADIGVLASHEEGFSNALLEMMARGVPMIATAVGGNVDAIASGQSGLLVPAEAPAALAEALLQLAGDPVLRTRLGQNGRVRVLALFSLDACVDRYVNLYRGIARVGAVPVQDVIEGRAQTAAAL
jgi:glycosyltransferase involved in cell wall biosynthesis